MRQWNSIRRDDNSINIILDILYGYQKSRVLLSACELDLFSRIGTDIRTADELAIELNIDKRATERMLAALCSMKLLERTTGKYANTKISLRFLVKSKPEYMDIMGYNSYVWDKWSNLTESIRSGKAVDFTKIRDYDADTLEAFINMVQWRANLLAPEVARLVDVKDVNNFLDLSSGVGDYAVGFKHKNPAMNASIYIYPEIEKYVVKNLEEERLKDKINILSGDYKNDDIGSGYDMVFLSFVMHHDSIWENINLARKIYDSLKPGGKIVVQDYFVSDDRISPEHNALFALEMLCNSDSGDTFTGSDMWIILKEAWFNNVEKFETNYGTSIVIASR